MKGLIYRELILGKKMFCLIAYLLFMVVTLHVMLILSLRFGNLSKNPPEELESSLMILNCVEFVILFCSVDIVKKRIIQDIACGWNMMTYTFPGGIRQSIRVRYLTVFLLLFASFGIGSLVCCLISAISPAPVTKSVWIFAAVFFALTLALSCISIPLAYRLKKENKVNTVLFLPGVMLYIPILYFMSSIENEEEFIAITSDLKEKFSRIFSGYCLVWIVLLFGFVYLSYRITLSVAERKGR